MPFKRDLTNNFPMVWDEWESDGVKWTIEDIPPEDDELVTEMMLSDFLVRENLCSLTETHKDPESVKIGQTFWKEALSDRTSLACYKHGNGTKKLAAVNVLPMKCKEECDDHETDLSNPWSSVIAVLLYFDKTFDAFKELNVDKYLNGAGLLVPLQYRGLNLGTKLLEARKPLCKYLGIKATVTVFTGIASQRCAEKAGFRTLKSTSLGEFKKMGYPYPDSDSPIKLMCIHYELDM